MVQRLITRSILLYLIQHAEKPIRQIVAVLEQASDRTSIDVLPLRGVAPEVQSRASQLARERGRELLYSLGRFSRAKGPALGHRSTDDGAQSPTLFQGPSSGGSANYGLDFAKQAVQLRYVVRGLPLLYDGHDLSQCFPRSQGQPPSTVAIEEG